MSDRRPSKLSEKIARLLAKDDGDIAMDDALGLLIEVQSVLDDSVAVVRRGVESGTIKGEVVSLDGANVGDGVPDDEVALTFYVDREKGVEWFRRNFRVVVIPVSDGGSET